jgi:hypothetical protein
MENEDIYQEKVLYVPTCFALDMDDSWLPLIDSPIGSARDSVTVDVSLPKDLRPMMELKGDVSFEVLSVSSEFIEGRMQIPAERPISDSDIVVRIPKWAIKDVSFADGYWTCASHGGSRRDPRRRTLLPLWSQRSLGSQKLENLILHPIPLPAS